MRQTRTRNKSPAELNGTTRRPSASIIMLLCGCLSPLSIILISTPISAEVDVSAPRRFHPSARIRRLPPVPSDNSVSFAIAELEKLGKGVEIATYWEHPGSTFTTGGIARTSAEQTVVGPVELLFSDDVASASPIAAEAGGPLKNGVSAENEFNGASQTWINGLTPSYPNSVQPDFLRLPGAQTEAVEIPVEEGEEIIPWIVPDAPLGFAGPSGIRPTEVQTDGHFVPVEDRWRIGFSDYDRYDRGFPIGEDYIHKKGNWWDPYNQNVFKGDYPIIGQHTFLNITVESISIIEGRQVPTATTPFESTLDPNQEEFFGDPTQFFYSQPVFLSFDLFHGDAGFKPLDWQFRVTPVFNANLLDVNELGIVRPNVQDGTKRSRDDFALEEWFIESKIADIGPDYDFMSARAGSQFFVSDFRGFIFFDTNRAVRLFGTRLANRDQFNVLWLDQTEKDTNSQLNTFDDRHQNTVIMNYYRQDFIWPGYTSQWSFHYNRDQASVKFDDNDFLVRPDPVGVFRRHEVESYYLGWAGDGHINRINVTHAFYYVIGEDELNPIAGRRQEIDAQMAAVELSIDRDWARFRTSFFWASGDGAPKDGKAKGFDAIFPDPNFAGGEFSYWQRQAIQLFGVQLVNDRSLAPSLRSSRIEGQTNFVNPGLLLFNIGMDMDITPKTKMISNVNFLWFEEVETLRLFTFQETMHHQIGTDLSLGVEYRPLLNDNLEIIGGISGLIPGTGFEDLYSPLRGDADGLFAGFFEIIAIY